MPRRASWADARATHGSNRRSGGGASPPADVPCADCECVRASGSSCRSFAVVRCTRSAGGRCLVAQSRRGSLPLSPSWVRRGCSCEGEYRSVQGLLLRRAPWRDGDASSKRPALHRVPRARAAIQESWSGELFATSRRLNDALAARDTIGQAEGILVQRENVDSTCVQPARASLAAGQHQARRSGCSAGLRARTPWARSTPRVQQLTEVGTAGRAGAVPISFTAPARWLTEGQPGSITCLARASGTVEQPAGRVACGVQPGRIRGHRPGCPHAVRRGRRDQRCRWW